MHSLATSYFATYRLAQTTKHPASQYRGEWAGDASDRLSYAASLKEDYHDLVERIEANDEDDVDDVGGTRTHGGFAKAVTPGSKTKRL